MNDQCKWTGCLSEEWFYAVRGFMLTAQCRKDLKVGEDDMVFLCREHFILGVTVLHQHRLMVKDSKMLKPDHG